MPRSFAQLRSFLQSQSSLSQKSKVLKCVLSQSQKYLLNILLVQSEQDRFDRNITFLLMSCKYLQQVLHPEVELRPQAVWKNSSMNLFPISEVYESRIIFVLIFANRLAACKSIKTGFKSEKVVKPDSWVQKGFATCFVQLLTIPAALL